MSKPSKKRLSGMLKTALATLFVVIATVFATLYVAAPQAMRQLNLFAAAPVAVEPEDPATAPPSAPIDVPAPIFLELDPFTAMLRDAQGRRRVLYAATTLRLGNDEARAILTEYMPEVRDRVLRTLSEQDPITVQTPDGRTRLAQALINTLEAPYHPHLPAPHVYGVLFTAFVVQ